jgi:hypothetical protein
MQATANGIESLYNDELDVVLIRGAFAPSRSAAVGADLGREDRPRAWASPNVKMPVEDIQLLGTDTPGTPTSQAPRGASLEAYRESAARHQGVTAAALGDSIDAGGEFQRALSGCSGGRPVEVAVSADGRPYVPFTIRRLVDGRQIGVHHDHHYSLAMYSDLVPRVDTTTLVSFVVTLQAPEGGALMVYGLTPDTPGAPQATKRLSVGSRRHRTTFRQSGLQSRPCRADLAGGDIA